MSSKQILAIGLSVCMVLLAFAGYRLLTIPSDGIKAAREGAGTVYKDAKAGMKYAIDTCADVIKSIGQPVNISISQNDCLEVKPVIELVFSRVRVRSVMRYERIYLNSSKYIIGHQAFDIRIGWSQNDNIRMIVDTNLDQTAVRIYVPQPHRLSICKVEQSPIILAREDGMINKLTPEDGLQFSKELESDALASADWKEGQKVAKDGFEAFMRGLFQMQGLNVVFTYTDPTGQKLTSDPVNGYRSVR